MKLIMAILAASLVVSSGVYVLAGSSPSAPGVSGNLVFFYYKDLAGAKKFYEETLGLPLVLDYGFAVIYRISESSFVGLVDEKKGMHQTSEPKTVTLAFVTDEVDGWFQYLSERGVTIKSPLKDSTTINVRGFVALDPEGYFLEFENFLEAPRNTGIRERLKKIRPLYPGAGARPIDQTARPAGLGFRATIFWLYYNDLAPAQKFVEDVFEQTLLVDQGFSKVYPSSSSGFIGLVDQARGLHRYSETKSVNVVFQTPHLDAWFERFKSRGIKIKSELGEAEGSLVRAFVALDPAGYFLEFHWFKPDPKNEAILKVLKK